ncbi:cyclin, C-terminal domain-containing protein [Tanacetum coccineum]
MLSQDTIFDTLLLCDEQQEFGLDFEFIKNNENVNFLWENDELETLLCKEKNTHLDYDENLMVLRQECVDWMIRVGTHYGFVALTIVLSVNYFDRFLMSGCFQKDKPWMCQLVAVSCLSLASKVEEIQTPLLLDLQIEGAKFVFESKTIMKMELLVLSCLEWKMNPVTSLAFFDYIMRRLGLMTHDLCYEFLRRCERILLSVVNDSRFQGFLPSVMAAAIVCIVSKEIEPDNALDYRTRLIDLLNICEEKIEGCSKFIMDVSNHHGSNYFPTHKRRYSSVPGSPSGVVDAYFSSDNSNNSWAIASSVTSSPEPPFKKNRAQEQQMRLTPMNRVSISVLSSLNNH